jgi:hypothetical protein
MRYIVSGLSHPRQTGRWQNSILDFMSLLDRLRPRWQSADAEVRAQAVRDLDKAEVELLTAVAQQDPDARVRRIAVKKLDSPRLLLELAEKDEDAGLRAFALKRARQILVHIACDRRDLEESRRAFALLQEAPDRVTVLEKAHFAELRSAAFEVLTDDDSLVEVVRRARDPELRSGALDKIRSPQALKKVIVDESSGDLALAALARVEDLETLEAIVEQHTLPRPVRRQAFTKLERLVPADHPIKARGRAERFSEVCARAESLADSRLHSAALELPSLVHEWSEIELGGAPEAKLLSRYRAAVERLEALAESGQKPEATEAAPTADPPPVADEREAPLTALIEQVEKLEADSLENGLEEAKRAWRDIAGERPVAPALRSRFTRAERAARARLAEWAEGKARVDEIETLVGRAEAAAREPDLETALLAIRGLERKWARAASGAEPVDVTLLERFRSALGTIESREQEQRRDREAAERAALSELEARIQLMISLASAESVSIKDADRTLREAQDFLRSMGPLPRDVNRRKARRRLLEAREALFKRTQDTRELEEWKRWANVDIQAGLIERMEKLLASNDLPRVAKEMRLIHEEWRRAGAATPEKAPELWNRYKTMRDELKTRCDAFFEKQARERAETLKKKEELCAEVEALQDSEDWSKTAEAIQEIQARWKKLGPVPPESSDAVWKRFRAACDRFFDRRKESFRQLKSERDENLTRKEALCERAESMMMSTDWERTANEIKSLQAQWRDVGAVPRKKSDEVWMRFRAACDRFFDRYKRRDQVENEDRLRKREELVAELSSLGAQSEGSREPRAARVQEIWAEWKKLGAPTDESQKLRESFETEVGALVLKAPESFAGSELDPAASAKRREKFCARLEAIVQELGAGKPEPPALENLAQRLKDALASNTIAGVRRHDTRLDWRAASEEVARLRSSWIRSAPVAGEKGKILAERFERAVRSFSELRPSDSRYPKHGDGVAARSPRA